ncbi:MULTISPECIES: hypothetical protein [unclassified Nostoc]|uniref:hypothetical protein n=1 Tax=unclassified Nostoc TaxID=2593658 RepID=UPI0025D6F5DA|nr:MULTISPECIES: hypothetical protein [unclassified Nostoc]MBN3994720.1 hypothetical protein [Nostoc sp. NMS2]
MSIPPDWIIYFLEVPYDLPHNITLPQIEDVKTSLQSKIQNRSTERLALSEVERSRSPKSKIDRFSL